MLPKNIGLVSSKKSAAYKDVLRTIGERFKVRLHVADVLTQGVHASKDIINGIKRLNNVGVNLILVVRGGGSIEDLAAYNDEGVARAIRASKVPVITGIGHDTDVTIADLAADKSEATPTGAAKKAVPDKQELVKNLGHLKDRLDKSYSNNMNKRKIVIYKAVIVGIFVLIILFLIYKYVIG